MRTKSLSIIADADYLGRIARNAYFTGLRPDIDSSARTQRRNRVTVERVAVDESGDDTFVVHCHQIERFVPMINFGNWRAKLQFHAELERLGVIDALEQAGVEAGSTVRVGNRELEWD